MGLKRRLTEWIALLLFLAALAGCGWPGTPAAEKDAGYTVTEARSRQVRIPHKPEHIMTLGLYTDEMVLGMVPTSKMAAVSHYLDDPKESVLVEKAKKIPNKVTDPTVEQILSWHPDLVIANGWTSEDKIQTLTDMGIPVVVCGPANSYAEIQETLRLVAESIGEVEKGEKIEFIKVSEGYSPIEIYSEKIKIDERSDVYSLMAILYFMFCGKKVDGVIERFYKPELEFEREVILGFEKIEKFKKMEEVIKKGLEYEREKRFGSVKEMVEEIKKFEPKVLKNCK